MSKLYLTKQKKINMNNIGVITGDIVNSSSIKNKNRQQLLAVLKSSFREINNHVIKDKKSSFEIFRGDSFQAILKKPELTLLASMLIRAKLRSIAKDSTKHSSKDVWDARIAIGIGQIDYKSHKTIESDGQAFLLSGKTLDGMKKMDHRLQIATPWQDVNSELKVSFAFADAIINDWSNLQAEAFYEMLLTNKMQKDVSKKLDISAVALHLRLKTGKYECLKLFLKRFENIMTSKI